MGYHTGRTELENRLLWYSGVIQFDCGGPGRVLSRNEAFGRIEEGVGKDSEKGLKVTPEA
jgi:hypothetical protein